MYMWIPYTKVPDIGNPTYTSIYNNSNTISNDLWGPNTVCPCQGTSASIAPTQVDAVIFSVQGT